MQRAFFLFNSMSFLDFVDLILKFRQILQREFFVFNSMSFLGFYGTSEVSILRNALRIDLDDVLASIMKLSLLTLTRLELLKK